ncbi:hypothetical protein [Streptomyces sp. NPDC056255]|uniref:hypothetical protein n=1 Tax=Streptomyces sp. NPDC056255 TaxID=3345764 RepID=UPI0035D9E441
MRARAGAGITAKDFRNWHVTVLAAVALAVSAQVANESKEGRTVVGALSQLGGGVALGQPATQEPVEEEVLRLLT